MLELILVVFASAVAVVVTYFGFRWIRAAQLKAQVRCAFAQYLSPALVEQLAAPPSRLKLGGECRKMTVMICGLRDYDGLSAAMRDDLEGLMHLVNRFLTPMTDAIMAQHGIIDKYIGARIMAFWNAPQGDPDHALHACRSALAMIDRLRELNLQLQQEARVAGREHRPFSIGIGIDTGDCMVGNMGSEQRFDYSVMGPVVTSAFSLARRSQDYGVDIIVGEGTRARVPRLALLELDLVGLSETEEPMRIFALLGDEAMAQSAEFKSLTDRHEAMLACYRRREWGDAREHLSACRGREPRLERCYALFDERVGLYEANPPNPDWRGVSFLSR